MKTINLRTYYYPHYTEDVFVEVSDEVAEAMLLSAREMENYRRRTCRHKAYYSLDREDGIENDAVCGFEKSPEEIFIEQEEERFFRLTLERLEEALSHLTPTQQRRIRVRYLSGMTVQGIAASEGVSVSVVSESIRSGLKKLRTYFDKKKWRKFEE